MSENVEKTEGHSRGLVLGLVLGALLVVGGILATILSLTDGDQEAAPSPTVAIETSDVDVCGQPAGSQDMPAEDFAGHPVALDSGVRIAQLDGAGPCVLTEMPPHGYAHSPSGALLAAANYATLISIQGETMAPVIEQLTVPGPDTDTMLQAQADDPLPPAEAFQVQGFKIYELNENEYRITLAVKAPGVAQPVAWTLPMSWDGQDWKASPADPGAGWDITSMQGVTIDGFTTWGF